MRLPLLWRLRYTAEQYGKNVLSCFKDNAGIIRLCDGWGIAGKVETHNSPSAIEPYGGAATGSGGVFRDICGVGQGAEVVLSTDMFCLAPPDLDAVQLPPGCLDPQYLLRNVVRGVRDYGNRMGIPTANGSFHFHPDFRAKPSVIVGAYGIIPESRCEKGTPQIGDKIVIVGGCTGRDGIHGATFSSGDMTEQTHAVNASAVQIGNAIEEKRTFDAIIACRDADLIRAITDCGAGGFSSAIGEIGSDTGVRVELEKAPLKYSGLAPWEIWVSESQERMVAAVTPENTDRFVAICRDHNVEATVIGEFTDTKRLVVTHDGEPVCDLEMEFLHHGLPQRTLTANWVQPKFLEPTVPVPATQKEWVEAYKAVMAHGSVCSKESVVRQYDHGVQGTNVVPPYGGVHSDAPNDAVVLRPFPDKDVGIVVAHGLNPVLNRIDPYHGSLWAITEALSNAVAVGADHKDLALIDNFIWPTPDEESLGSLDLAVDACVDASNAFQIPFVSGKDSLSSTYRGKDGTVIKIPPVLCISAFGSIKDVRKTMTSDFKRTDSLIVLVGGREIVRLGGSVYFDIHGTVGNDVPLVDLPVLPRTFDAIHKRIADGTIFACHDISEGGVAAALAEMCFGGDIGAVIEVSAMSAVRPDYALFAEMAGCFLVEMADEGWDDSLFDGVPFHVIGKTIPDRSISIALLGNELFTVGLETLKAAWKRPMQEVFP
jgi:phosphoribosylformylglycinamidine synthase